MRSTVKGGPAIAHKVATLACLVAPLALGCGEPGSETRVAAKGRSACPGEVASTLVRVAQGARESQVDSIVYYAERANGTSTTEILAFIGRYDQRDAAATRAAMPATYLWATRRVADPSARMRLGLSLGRLLQQGYVRPSALVDSTWSSWTEWERLTVIDALRTMRADSASMRAVEGIACLELRAVRRLFEPRSATTLMDLSYEPGPLIAALRTLWEAGPQGRAAFDHLQAMADSSAALGMFVRRIRLGLVMETATTDSKPF